MKEYSIDMVNPEYAQVLQFILATNVPHKIYLTQLRFTIPDGNISHKFADRFPGTCTLVDVDDSTPLQ